MEASSKVLPVCAGIHPSPVVSRTQSQLFRSMMTSLLLAWNSCGTNNRISDKMGRPYAHLDPLECNVDTSVQCHLSRTHISQILISRYIWIHYTWPLIARFMGPTWGPSGADRTQMGPMLAPWTLLSGTVSAMHIDFAIRRTVPVPWLWSTTFINVV